MKLTIAGTAIRQDTQGRYLINDLHRASGEEDRHRPGRWIRSKETQETIDFLMREGKDGIPSLPNESGDQIWSPLSAVARGINQGTWACWELVYDYAMWVSPAFKIKVIRAYNAMLTRPLMQHEKSVVQRYEFYPKLRDEVLQGHTDTQIAPVIGRSAGSVGYHRNKQFTEATPTPWSTPTNAIHPLGRKG